MDDKLRKELSRENLNRLSSDFEVELLRLIKTLNLISQSKELYKNQVEEIESISNNLKIRINDFTIKLLEIEKGARESAREYRSDFSSSADNNESNDYETIIKEVNEFREKINVVDKDIERAKVEHLSKLDSFYSVYNLELKASQGELDTKLSDIKELLAVAVPEPAVQESAAPEIPSAPEPSEAEGNGSDEQPMPEPPPVREAPQAQQSEFQKPFNTEPPKRSINLSHLKPKGDKLSIYASNGIIVGIIFLFFGALVGISSYYLLDYIGGDEAPHGLREGIYSEDSITLKEEYSSQTTPDINTSPVNETLKKEVPVKQQTVKIEPEDTNSTIVEEPEQETPSANIPLKYFKDEPVKTASLDTSAAPDADIAADVYTVVGVGANVRSGPGINHSVSTVVLEGDEFVALGERRGIWIKVMTPDGTEGWISKKVVKQINWTNKYKRHTPGAQRTNTE